ncbi:MAG: hypothetical protein KJ607_05925, partial [Bacteroidetes bacterium]|nr:hypothetical protein [Bacteroidota bacterium]
MKHFTYPLVLLVFLTISVRLFAQHELSKNKLFRKAIGCFEKHDYSTALDLLLKIDTLFHTSFEVQYYIGVCYLNSLYEKEKAVPYLEYSMKMGKKYLPCTLYKDLGIIYHETYRFEEAIECFIKFLMLTDVSKNNIRDVEHRILNCYDAMEIINDTVYQNIVNIGSPVNTGNSEYSPFISADNTTLYYSTGLYSGREIEIQQKNIYSSVKTTGSWSVPKAITFGKSNKSSYALAGVSPDGEILYTEKDGDIYFCLINEEQCDEAVKLGDEVNSPFRENSVSITPDRQVMYFSSARPGGYGGMDIYRVERLSENSWAAPVNIGSEINTEFNDDAPFVLPDGKTLYFASGGHKNMGGYDIFVSHFEGGVWSIPENIGYPVNSTKDDIHFSVSGNGNTGYFASSVHNPYGRHDIYEVKMKQSIPLTLVKGTILAGNPLMPVKARIKVIDNETGKKVNYIYSPNPLTGTYLMIFPPAKNYDMIVEAQGFLPQLINIYVPDQTYYYELYQEIQLLPLCIFNEQIGEKLKVSNTFYDIHQAERNTKCTGKEYNDLEKLIESIITTSDRIGMERLEQITVLKSEENNEVTFYEDTYALYENLMQTIEDVIENTDTLLLDSVRKNTVCTDKGERTYFYDKSGSRKDLQEIVIGKDTLYTTSRLKVGHTGFSAQKLQTLPDVAESVPGYSDSDLPLADNFLRTKVIREDDRSNYAQAQHKPVTELRILFNTGECETHSMYINSLTELSRLIR